MTNEEYWEEQSKRFDQRYGWVEEYNHDVAWSWLDDRKLKNLIDILFKEDEIKYWGLEGCYKTLIHQY